MKERPILFSGEMVNALLDGRKTMTRRVVPAFPFHDDWKQWNCRPEWERRDCPYGQTGDRLWVRETWTKVKDEDGEDALLYKASGTVGDAAYRGVDFQGFGTYYGKWNTAIFMPRWASRLTLEITAVRVERVRDITEEDAKAEGVDNNHACHWPDDDPGYMHDVYRRNFSHLWDSLNAKRGYGWDVNPWVWAISFRRLP